MNDILDKAHAECSSIGGGLSSKELCGHIAECLIDIKANNIPGNIINLGVYRGWSMRFMAEICKDIGLDRKIIGFDTFCGFPSPKDERDKATKYMGRNVHTSTSIELVNRVMEGFNYALVKGDISDTVHSITDPICLALFDMDDYTPTKVALHPVYKQLSNGGFIVHDHFCLESCENAGTYGQRDAMKEFLEHTKMDNRFGPNVFVKWGQIND